MFAFLSARTLLPADDALAARQQAFERAWLGAVQGGPSPSWVDFLPPEGQACSSEFLLLLIQTDIEYRLRSGQTALLTDCYFQHPRVQAAGAGLAQEQQVEVIRWEYAQRWQRGQRARRQDYLTRFPHLAKALNDLVPR
jgi:hypothetical protein